jgi:hypothetical protein
MLTTGDLTYVVNLYKPHFQKIPPGTRFDANNVRTWTENLAKNIRMLLQASGGPMEKGSSFPSDT